MKNTQEQALFTTLAPYYDIIYSSKEYEAEAKLIKKLILRYKKSLGNQLLDVACGTAKNLLFLQNEFECTGVDINAAVIELAKKRFSTISFYQQDMVTLSLGKQFDVILCLFCSIGYVKSVQNLQKTLHSFSSHLKKGGVVIIEPWFTPTHFKEGTTATTYEKENVHIARVRISTRENSLSKITMHYLIADHGKDVQYVVDYHELGLFEKETFLDCMNTAGFESYFLEDGLIKDKGIYVGIKK